MDKLGNSLERVMKQIEEKAEENKGKVAEYKCSKCEDVGYILDRETNTIERKCECRVMDENLERIKRSGLQGVIEKCTFDNFKTENDFQRRVKQRALDYTNNFEENEKSKKWFYIGGQTGAGKTHLCTAICSYLMNHKALSLKYVIANKIISELKACAMDTVKRNEIFNSLMSRKVLYIDDLFKSRTVTDADVKVIFDIINDRYNENLITIISSEKRLEELENMDELEAVTGRIIEKAKGFIVNIGKDSGKNYRKRDILEL